jgi:hypothetical protein
MNTKISPLIEVKEDEDKWQGTFQDVYSMVISMVQNYAFQDIFLPHDSKV